MLGFSFILGLGQELQLSLGSRLVFVYELGLALA